MYIIVHNMFLQEHSCKIAVMFLQEPFRAKYTPSAARYPWMGESPVPTQAILSPHQPAPIPPSDIIAQ